MNPQFKRFWKRTKVEKVSTSVPTACWRWQGYCHRFGHGQIKADGWVQIVHRLAYQMVHSKDLPVNILVRHKCDIPNCWRPSHLLEGTHVDNVQDRVDRGRSAIGVNNGRAKLDVEKVRGVRALIAGGYPDRQIADKYGVNPRAIGLIRHGKNWAWVK